MEETREKGLWFGCNKKWSQWHKCKETKFPALEDTPKKKLKHLHKEVRKNLST